MPHRSFTFTAAALFALAATPTRGRAQDPAVAPAPCHLQSCALVIDWGPGNTAATYGSDRKYGSGDDFEAKFRSALANRGIRTKDAPAAGELTITIRPTMRPRSMCDVMPGTGTDMTCTAMSDLAVTFSTTDAAAKAPPAMRVSNRCGAGNVFMTMFQFGQYSADLIYFTLEGSAKKEPRPVSRC